MRVALVWRGDPDASPPKAENTRLRAVFEALDRRGIDAMPVVYADDVVDDVCTRLSAFDGVLVWVDPITDGADRSRLDPMLRALAARGIWVSAHPDIVLAVGTKDVLYATRDMSWGTDTRRYGTLAEFCNDFPKTLAEGRARVLKQFRGNGGNGVWKVELVDRASVDPAQTQVRVRHARRGSVDEETTLGEFIDRCATYFDHGGRLIDQPYEPRLVDGMVRCYLVQDRVAGFGEQLINALFPTPRDTPGREAPQPGPRLYYPPTRSDLQGLKHTLESEWVPELCRRFAIGRDQLPVIWDADFLYGPKTAAGDDTYVLGEINVSAVFPFPDSALEPLAEAVEAQLRRRG